MSHSKTLVGHGAALVAVLWLALSAAPALAHGIIGMDEATMRQLLPEFFAPQLAPNQPPLPQQPARNNPNGIGIEALPDVDGPGAVLTVGRVIQKVTNWGLVGNPFTNRSSDPSSQWPGASAVEYLNLIGLAVGAVNPIATDPTAVRRVSYLLEWRPKTLDPEDKIYRGYDGIINGQRFVNDDNDRDPFTDEQIIDEDFLDGRDNDGDGKIDEDYAALGQQMFSFTMWDNTQEAINTTFNEKHVPLGLECRQSSWAYSLPGFQDFNIHQYEIYNRSGHMLDSMFVGFICDMDCGPIDQSSYWSDDYDIPTLPSGFFPVKIGQGPNEIPDLKRAQTEHDNDPKLPARDYPSGTPLCPFVKVRINGFSVADDNGDEGKTLGVPSVFLIDDTTDPLGVSGPDSVEFSTFRSFINGTPYQSGGHPTTDHDKFDMMSKRENVDLETGFVNQTPGETKGDYAAWFVVGPWRFVPDGGRISVTIGFGVTGATYQDMSKYPSDYQRYVAGVMTAGDLMDKYPPLANAMAAQIAFEGIHEVREGYPRTTWHGRETHLRAGRGQPQFFAQDCRDASPRLVNDLDYTWFDFDCDFCTGVWDPNLATVADPSLGGLFHKTWSASAPPPSPNVNISAQFNFSDNPQRTANLVPGQDGAVELAWDNLSEVTPDPKSTWFDFRGYRIWKASDWTRPVGSAGPADADWQLLGEFRIFDYYNQQNQPIERNYTVDSTTSTKNCPLVFIPNYLNPETGVRDTATIPICLDRGDLWNRQNGEVIKPDTTVDCVRDESGECVRVSGCKVGTAPCSSPANTREVTKYPVGRYRYVDHEVKNGFIYFYSFTAFDSTTLSGTTTELSGRRSAVESESVVPQISAKHGKGVWVVPNPYRGYARIQERPSAWDLTPNASDPTGTHIDFMGLPDGRWTIKIFTVSGDLVQTIHSDDPVNESVRSPVKDASGHQYPGYNRQQDNPRDGQASWNLISRNGQDIVSGIYLFSVESKYGTERGRFVVIR